MHFNALEGSYALCLTANLIHLVLFHDTHIMFLIKNIYKLSLLKRSLSLSKVSLNSENFHSLETDFVKLVNVFMRLLVSKSCTYITEAIFALIFTICFLLKELCGHYVIAKQSSTAHWHPVLGWFSCRMDTYIQESLPTV